MRVLEAIEKIKKYDNLNTTVEIEVNVTVIVRPSYVHKNPNKKIDFIQNVQHIVCNEYGVTEEEIKSEYKGRTVSDAKSVLWTILRDSSYKITYKQIGKIYNRSHSSVMHQVEKLRGFMQVDKKLRDKIDLLMKKVEIIE